MRVILQRQIRGINSAIIEFDTANVAPFTATIKNKKSMKNTIEQKLQRIEQLTLLAAKEALTMDDAADYTGLSKSYLYRLVCKKQIGHYKSVGGKQTYFKKSELNDWLLHHRVATTEELEQIAASYVLNNPRKGGRK